MPGHWTYVSALLDGAIGTFVGTETVDTFVIMDLFGRCARKPRKNGTNNRRGDDVIRGTLFFTRTRRTRGSYCTYYRSLRKRAPIHSCARISRTRASPSASPTGSPARPPHSLAQISCWWSNNNERKKGKKERKERERREKEEKRKEGGGLFVPYCFFVPLVTMGIIRRRRRV